jgi:hypothetical protein
MSPVIPTARNMTLQPEERCRERARIPKLADRLIGVPEAIQPPGFAPAPPPTMPDATRDPISRSAFN